MDLAYNREHTLELIKKTFNSKIKIEVGDLNNKFFFFFFYRNAKMCQLVQI